MLFELVQQCAGLGEPLSVTGNNEKRAIAICAEKSIMMRLHSLEERVLLCSYAAKLFLFCIALHLSGWDKLSACPWYEDVFKKNKEKHFVFLPPYFSVHPARAVLLCNLAYCWLFR